MSVRKNQVEKHYMNQCRNCTVLSCIDCGKDFPGDAYKVHTSCISEAEKYQGNLYQEKENKGEAKQKAWVTKLQERTSSVKDPKIAGLMGKIADYSNVPRKKKKFENFCKNSVRVYDQMTLDKLWTVFMGDDDKPAATNGSTQEATVETNGQVVAEVEYTGKATNDSAEPKEESIADALTTTKEKKKKKNKDEGKMKSKNKRKLEEAQAAAVNEAEEEEPASKKKNKKKKKNNTDDANEQPMTLKDTHGIRATAQEEEVATPVEADVMATPGGKFHWHKAIKTALRESADQELPMKKLRKKVLSAYSAHGTDHRAQSKDESITLFDKKIKTYPKVKVSKEMVKLVTCS